MPIGAFRLNSIAAAATEAAPLVLTGGTGRWQESNNPANYSYWRNPAGAGVNYRLHFFTTPGTSNLTATGAGTVDILLVGGGGAGGGTTTAANAAGGAGAGGQVVYQTGVSVSANTYSITVGAEGAGVSAANGAAGSDSTGLGYTALGGGAGTMNSAATNGGGSGASSTTSYTSTAGSYPYKGGNSFGSATGASRASGGGAGAGAVGTNAASTSGGAGGIGVSNSIDFNTYYYGNGAGGSGTGSGGQVYNINGSLGSQSIYGSGRTTAGNGNSATGSLASFGQGGGGALNTVSGTARTGGTGKQGIAIVRYVTTNDFIHIVESGSSSRNTGSTIGGFNCQDGDIGIIVQVAKSSSTSIPALVTPSGWTNVVNVSQGTTVGFRMAVHYKILTFAENGSSLTGMNATGENLYYTLLYRPSKSFTLSTASVNQQATSSAPTNQLLTMTSQTGPYIGFAINYSNATPSYSSTVTPTRTLTASELIVSTFEAIDSAVSFASSTISQTDTGVNGMASFRLVLT
jgi:hypothetical protein